MNYEKLRQNPSQFLALTSFNVEEFDTLLLHFSKDWEKYNETYLYNGSYRLNKAPNQGRGKLPSIGHKLFFILYYYKNNPIQEALAASFDMQQSQSNLWIKKIENVLEQTLSELGLVPARNVETFRDYLVKHQEQTQLLLDGVERPVLRSLDDEDQKKHYSGKKKRHCVKNNVISDFSDKILYLSKTYQGTKHDKGICNEEPFEFPKDIECFLWQDTGFEGHHPEHVTVLQPIKKKKGVELTDKEKKYNRSISKFRVYVEHAICGIKRLRIVKDCLRNWRQGCRDKVMQMACALHNFRISVRNPKQQPIFASNI